MVLVSGCITGQALSDDEQLPGLDDGTQTIDTEAVPQTEVPLVEADGPDDVCGDSPALFRVTGLTGAVSVQHEGIPMPSCVGWTPAATRDDGTILLEYLEDGDASACPDTCPFDFSFVLTVPAGDYAVVWQDEEVLVTVD
jgi:hypothetical protein